MAYDKQTWDTTSYVNPTRMNHIEDGIANAMTSDTQGVLGAKNLLPLSLDRIKRLNTSGTWSGNVLSKNNCTYTVNTDSKGNVLDITLNGTPSAQGEFILYQTTSESCPFNGFYLSGCTGGSNAKFDLRVSDIDVTSNVNYNNDSVISLNDTGKWKSTILVRQSVSISNVKFYPMIRLAGDNDNTYYPYAMTNKQITDWTRNVKKNYILILNKNNLSTSATSYDCNWKDYTELYITLGTYENLIAQMEIPSTYFDSTTSENRVIIRYIDTSFYEIYKNGDDKVYIKGTNVNENDRIKIYGVKYGI